MKRKVIILLILVLMLSTNVVYSTEVKSTHPFKFDETDTLKHYNGEEDTYRTLIMEDMQPMGPADINVPFTDVEKSDWYYPQLKYSYVLGAINGKTETTFAPYDTLTLAEAAKIAATCHSLINFSDEVFEIKGDNWYDVYTEYCYEKEIIPKNVTFDWNRPATRGEMAFIFAGIEPDSYLLNDVPLTDIPDVDENTKYYKEINKLFNMGIVTGSDEFYTFYPENTVRRSEVAAFTARIISFRYRIELPKG